MKIGAWLARPASDRVPNKPATLAYGLEEYPPATVTWVSAAQQVGVCAIFMVYPLIIARQAGLPADQTINILQLGFLVLAVATLLQALPRGPVGSRLLAPSIFTGIYLAPALLAVKAGGMALVWGMTIFAGVVEMALAQVWTRLRPFIPPETAGLVVFLVGTIIGLAAFRVLLDDNPLGVLSGRDGMAAACSLAVMIALNIWNKGRSRLFCILIGMAAGYIFSGALGLLSLADVKAGLNHPLVAFPSLSCISWTFDWSMVMPFAVSALASAMSSTAVITTYQRLTDADWARPEMTSIGRGVFGDGIATTIAGLFGTYGVTVSSANVGLVAATGVASRVVAFAIAVILVLAALEPKLIGLLTIMPHPVMSAAMLFTAVFIMISGVQIISTRVLDARRTLVIGMGLLSFVVVSVHPAIFTRLPPWAHPLVTSPLVLATLVALCLNLLFRIGIRRNVVATIDPAESEVHELTDVIERSAGAWGARRDVASRIEFAVKQAVEAVIGFCNPAGPITLEISFDEFVVQVALTYNGLPLEFPTHPPTSDEITDTEHGYQRLAGFLIRHHADRVGSSMRDGQTVVRLHFDH